MRGTLFIACTLCLTFGLVAAAGPGAASEAPAPAAPPARAEHPDVGDTAQTCTECHADITPAIHESWYAGAHGLNNVQCFVCHGSTTERFAAQPSTERCDSCHSAETESMEALGAWVGMEDATCFSCHPPHRLSPHAVSTEPAPSESTEEGGTR